MESLRVVVVALPPRGPLVDGHNLDSRWCFYCGSGKGREGRQPRLKKKFCVSYFFSFYFVVVFSFSFFFFSHPEPVPDRRVDLDGLAVEHFQPFAVFCSLKKGRNFRLSESVFSLLLLLVLRGRLSRVFARSLSLSLYLCLSLFSFLFPKLTLREVCSTACRRHASR